jgi:multidrug efflux pump subunit AcrA (membrane-fusion protein)
VKRGAALFLALALSASGVGCHKPDAQATTDKDAKPAATAPVAAHFGKVMSQKLPRRLQVTGTLDADEHSEIAAQTGGIVLAVPIDLGTRVKKGDVLVELDPREASLKLATASATADQQRKRLGLDPTKKFDVDSVADVRAAKEALDMADTEFQRAEALYKDGAIAQAEYDQARSNKTRAEAQYEVAKNSTDQAFAGLSAADAQAGLSKKSLDDTKIKAPFDGVIAEKRISEGEYASPGKIVAVLVKDDVLRLHFDVAEADIASVQRGAEVEIHVAAFPDKAFKGVVEHIGASVKVQSRTLPVEAEVENADGQLKPGLFATATVALGGEPVPTLLVPRSAVGPAGASHHVFVKKGDRVEERLVSLGALVGPNIEVRGHLAEGDEVAIDALDQLTDSALVTSP